MSKVARVRKDYRIRADIVAELNGMVRLVNDSAGSEGRRVTETILVEEAIAYYVRRFKKRLGVPVTVEPDAEG